MKASILDEPELQFGGGMQHIDPRFGIADYGPADMATPTAPGEILVGLVGPQKGIEGARRWLERCREAIEAKQPNKAPRLFRDFPGFDQDRTFRSRLVFDDAVARAIPQREISRALTRPGALATTNCVELYAEAVQRLAELNRCKVIVCARPEDLTDEGATAEDEDETDESSVAVDLRRVDFHDLLKARCLEFQVPIQLIRPSTWGSTRRTRPRVQQQKQIRPSAMQLQDEATRAWNIHTALYYKAGGVPWRLVRRSTDLTSIFVGISFFHSPARDAMHSSVAQVFNERGDGVVVRGGPAAKRKDDRQPHLSELDAHDLLLRALDAYRQEHGNFPARVVLHKTSSFDDSEIRGFGAACDERNLAHVEFVWVQSGPDVRLFRQGDHAVLRGTVVELDRDSLLLFTRGSIDFYNLYPGMYVPAPIGLHMVLNEHEPMYLAAEILMLSKMNWNQSQLDGRLPITLRAARRVAEIIKHVPNVETAAARYANYM